MLIRDKMTSLGIELNQSITAELVAQGIEAFRKNKKYIDYASDWYVRTTDKEVIIAMSATDGFLSGSANNDFSENKFRIHGWLECFFATKGISPRDVKFNHYCGFGAWNRDKEYTHIGTGRVGKFFQTVERFGAWSTGQQNDIKPYVEIQNWHGDERLNKFYDLAEKHTDIIDPHEYIRYVNEDKNRHLFKGEIQNLFHRLGQDQYEQLEVWAVLKYGPVNTTTWFQAKQDSE